LHLSDIHVDFEYQPGAPADCLDPLCCRNQSTPNPNSTASGAGYWGDYRNCDVPLWTVESMFDYISKNEQVFKLLSLLTIKKINNHEF
jgi:sphingomyelin phosphodiesterase